MMVVVLKHNGTIALFSDRLKLSVSTRAATDQKTHGSDRFADQSHGSDHFLDQQKKKKKRGQININLVFLFINTFKLLN